MTGKIRVAMFDNHQGILDGYEFRLSKAPDIEIVAASTYGEAVETMLSQFPIDVLLLDIQMPTSEENLNPYPVLFLIPRLLEKYPNLVILAISMHTQRKLIEAVMAAGASGYIVKDDKTAIRDLASVIRTVAEGGIYLSKIAYQQLKKDPSDSGNGEQTLSQRQLEILSLWAAYPDANAGELASKLGIANSTMRNILSQTYLKLNVRTRASAIAKARQLGWLSSDIVDLDLDIHRLSRGKSSSKGHKL